MGASRAQAHGTPGQLQSSLVNQCTETRGPPHFLIIFLIKRKGGIAGECEEGGRGAGFQKTSHFSGSFFFHAQISTFFLNG